MQNGLNELVRDVARSRLVRKTESLPPKDLGSSILSPRAAAPPISWPGDSPLDEYNEGHQGLNALIISFEDERWGAIRLVKALNEQGLAVAALCPPNHAMTQTRFARRLYALKDVKNGRTIETALSKAMRDWLPTFLIPGDERALAFLHALVRRAKSGAPTLLDERSLRVLTDSLGDYEHYNALLMKSETVALARRLGLRTPMGGRASTAREAVAWAERIGFPVYVKQSFSWAGQGVVRCNGPEEVASAFVRMQTRYNNPLFAMAKRLLHRDWYPVNSVVDMQKAIDGSSAFYTALAWKGEMLASFAGAVLRATSACGPSSVVRLGPHEEMAHVSSEMIAATGATGFVGFDFMIERETRIAFLLECNPRPVQCCHLGARIGVDLCQVLADAVRGDVKPHPPAVREETVALFPQAWAPSAEALMGFEGFVDVPLDDQALLKRMTLFLSEMKLNGMSLP